MEDVWLYGKTAVRKNPSGLLSFKDVKNHFEKELKRHKFKFEKLQKIRKVLQFK